MKRTCITCHHHLTERGRIVCGFDGKCEWGEYYSCDHENGEYDIPREKAKVINS